MPARRHRPKKALDIERLSRVLIISWLNRVKSHRPGSRSATVRHVTCVRCCNRNSASFIPRTRQCQKVSVSPCRPAGRGREHCSRSPASSRCVRRRGG